MCLLPFHKPHCQSQFLSWPGMAYNFVLKKGKTTVSLDILEVKLKTFQRETVL